MKTKKIKLKDLKTGMKIKTLDASGSICFRTVTDVFDTQVKIEDQVRLEFENGTIINCSVNHPIMCMTEAGIIEVLPNNLSTSHLVLSDEGTTNLVARTGEQSNPTGYIDITVDDTHTFFTSESVDGEMVLTHNSQGGVRNASATLTYPIWHYQFNDLIVLKNNQGTEETRVRRLDYSVVLNAFFWKRFKNKENITFFDPNEVPDLYEAFYSDTPLFEELYVKYENTIGLRKQTMSAEEVFKNGFLKERTDTGRIYMVFTDLVQQHSPFDPSTHPI